MNPSFIQTMENLDNLELELDYLTKHFNDKIVFSTSFSIEDQVITHVIFSKKIKEIEVFTLDTGRLFEETYSVWDKTKLQYRENIKVYFPNHEKVEKYINENGINAFYNSLDHRKECCLIRKVEPLNRALSGAKIWITGIRAEHSENRNKIKKIEWDEEKQLFKYNPLINWSTNDIYEFVKKQGITYNSLHDKNFISIGCAPCTRAVKPGENFRAGRWWWEDNSKKECGLHN